MVIKQLKSFREFRKTISSRNLHPVLADYANDIFRGLGSYGKVFFFSISTIFSNFNIAFCFLFNILVNIQVLLLRWPFLAFYFYMESYF